MKYNFKKFICYIKKKAILKFWPISPLLVPLERVDGFILYLLNDFSYDIFIKYSILVAFFLNVSYFFNVSLKFYSQELGISSYTVLKNREYREKWICCP